MGLDLGLEMAGFRPIVLNEIDSGACATIRANRPRAALIADDVRSVGLEQLNAAAGFDLRGIPLLAGGPPCQAFSVMGRRRGLADARGALIFEFVRLVGELQPEMFLLENVRGLLSLPLVTGSAVAPGAAEGEKGAFFELLVRDMEALGYHVDGFLVNSANYGAPQVRERLILIGNRAGQTVRFPAPTHSNRPDDGLLPFSTLRDAIGPSGFVDPDPTLLDFSERKLRYLRLVPPGGNWRSLPADLQQEAMGAQYFLKGGRSSSWRRLSWDFPSPTVHTMPNHATTSMCHPGEVRALTVGECAAIQEFPAGFTIAGRPAEKYRQVGNAVPVRLARIAGEVVKKALQSPNTPAVEGDGAERGRASDRVVHLRPHVRVRSWWRGGEALAGDHSYSAGKQARVGSGQLTLDSSM